jgi:hypothetical protein
MSAYDFADGTFAQASGGETSAPTPVYFSGIAPPSLNALLVNFIVIVPTSVFAGLGDADG